jgi:pimeloyl-ACP methyl ester carboxylesterase
MAATVDTTTVNTADGRELCVEIANAGGSPTFLVCAGMPNSRHLDEPWIRDAEERGIQLIGYDRPGYGKSTRQPGRTVADGVSDVRAILDALEIERAGVWGFSGGGPYVMACAALLPERFAAAGVLCSPAPYGAEGLDYFAGMGEDNVEDIKLTLTDREKSKEKGRQEWEEMMAVTPETLLEAWKTLLAPVDAALLTGDFARSIVHSIQDGLAPGYEGWWDDGVAHLEPWGFDVADIRIPVKVWAGRQDRFVGFQHGQWLAEHIPGAESGLSDSDGHLSLLVDVGYVYDWLLRHF